MERLTYRDADGTAMMKKRGSWQGEGIARLAAYEDTGLAPEEIAELQKQNDLLAQYGAQKFNASMADFKEINSLKLKIQYLEMSLSTYTQAEQEGRLVVLPCKVGDTVYAVKFATHEETEDGDLMPIAGGGEWVIWTVRVGIINYCDYRTKNTHGYVVGSTQSGSGVTFDFDDFGKTVFLTREEAERALAGGADHA